MKSKKSNAPKKISLRTILGLLIIFTGVLLTIIILVADGLSGAGTQTTEPGDITSEIPGEEGLEPDVDPLEDPAVSPEYTTIAYRGLEFTIPVSWHVQNTEEGLTIGIVEDGQANILLIEPMSSNLELPLENNLALVSTLFSEAVPDLERDAILVSGMPALRHQYEVQVDDIYYSIVGFLFPNGDELIYIQFGTPIEGTLDEDLLRFITRMIITLDLPPSEFPPAQ